MHFERQGSKDKAISEAQRRRNRRIASPSERVEHVFAGMAQKNSVKHMYLCSEGERYAEISEAIGPSEPMA